MSSVRRPGASRRLLRLAGIGSVVVLCGLLLGGHARSAVVVAILYLLPAIVLALALVAGRYPGVRVLERLRRRRPSRTARPRSSPAPRQHLAEALHGGRLIAASLAGRAPPVAAACC